MIRHNKEEPRLEISMDEQALAVIAGEKPVKNFRVSTGEKGMGFSEASFRTPTGRFEIVEKIGDSEPIHTIFKARKPNGLWSPSIPPDEEDLILTRILRLDGKDTENANTMERFIYIHGTNREDRIGCRAGWGCVRLANRDMIELFDLVEVGTPVEILPLTRPRGKLLFIDCDSTLATIEGIDELARAAGPTTFDKVVALTNAAMNGEVPLDEVFKRRMELIAPDKDMIRKVSRRYIETMVPGVDRFLSDAKRDGWLPVILSGGFAPAIMPLAHDLGIRHVEAVPLHFDTRGIYIGFGEDYPTTRNFGKNHVIREWKQALLPDKVVMIGDGISDLETKADVDLMIGFGGVVERGKVKRGADIWITDFRDIDMPRFLETK